MAEKGANKPIWLGWVGQGSAGQGSAGLGRAGLGSAGLAVLSSPGLSGSYQLQNFPLLKPLTSEGTSQALPASHLSPLTSTSRCSTRAQA